MKQRQTKILAFIKDFTTRHPYPPALREIVEGCGLSSTSVAQYNLRLLEQRGYLTRVPAARGIALTERGRAWSPVPPDSPGREAAAEPDRAATGVHPGGTVEGSEPAGTGQALGRQPLYHPAGGQVVV